MLGVTGFSSLGRVLSVALLSTFAYSAPAPLVAQDSTAPAIRAFLGTYCAECHGPEKQKGDRRFDQLAFPIAQADGLIDVQDIIDACRTHFAAEALKEASRSDSARAAEKRA